MTENNGSAPEPIQVANDHLVAALRTRIEALTSELILKDAYIAQLRQSLPDTVKTES